jgi:hypothetical protein
VRYPEVGGGNIVVLSIRLDEKDNVTTVMGRLAAGDEVSVVSAGGDEVGRVTAATEVPLPYHKIALVDIKVGETIVKYGEAIATASQPVRRGEWIHVHNAESADLPESEMRGEGDHA